MGRIPTWIKISIPIVALLLLIAAAGARLLLTKLPDQAQQTIAERYREQLLVLRELADTLPIGSCDDEEATDVMELIEPIRAWQAQIDERRSLFDDPVVLAAQVVVVCGSKQTSFEVKGLESKAPMWTPTTTNVEPGRWPTASLWYLGTRKVARYEDRITDPSGRDTRLQLLVDLDDLTPL